MWHTGLLDLSIWRLIATTLLLTHVTIVSVTVCLHRYSAHRALELHPALKHFFRFWLWLTTAMNTRVDRHPPQAPRQMRNPGRPAQPGAQGSGHGGAWGAEAVHGRAKNEETCVSMAELPG